MPNTNLMAEIGSDIQRGSSAPSIKGQDVGNKIEFNHSKTINVSTQVAPRIVKMTIHVYKPANDSTVENFEKDPYESNAAKTSLLIVFSVLLVVAIVSILVILIRIVCSL